MYTFISLTDLAPLVIFLVSMITFFISSLFDSKTRSLEHGAHIGPGPEEGHGKKLDWSRVWSALFRALTVIGILGLAIVLMKV